MSTIKQEHECPNCKETIQLVEYRKPYLKKIRRSKHGGSVLRREYIRVSAVRKWEVKIDPKEYGECPRCNKKYKYKHSCTVDGISSTRWRIFR